MGGGCKGEVFKVFFSSSSPDRHLCQSPSRPLPAPPPQVTLVCTGTFSLRFWVDGMAGVQVAGPGGRSRIRGSDGADRARAWAWGQDTSVGFFCVSGLSLHLCVCLCRLPVPNLLVSLAERLEGLAPNP